MRFFSYWVAAGQCTPPKITSSSSFWFQTSHKKKKKEKERRNSRSTFSFQVSQSVSVVVICGTSDLFVYLFIIIIVFVGFVARLVILPPWLRSWLRVFFLWWIRWTRRSKRPPIVKYLDSLGLVFLLSSNPPEGFFRVLSSCTLKTLPSFNDSLGFFLTIIRFIEDFVAV